MAVTTPLLERGICRPYTQVNQPVLSGDSECCDGAVTCMDSVTITDVAVVQGIVYTPACGPNAGVAQTITFPATATNAAAVVAAVQAALLPYELGVFVDFVNASTSFVLRHMGQGTLVAVTIGGSPSNATRLCTVRQRCEYTGSVGVTSTSIVVNGTLRDYSADIVYGTTSAATAQGIIQVSVDAASLTGGATVTVTDDPINSVFDISISARQGNTFVVTVTAADDVPLQEGNCEAVFEA